MYATYDSSRKKVTLVSKRLGKRYLLCSVFHPAKWEDMNPGAVFVYSIRMRSQLAAECEFVVSSLVFTRSQAPAWE